ncbi:sulfite exporter TauE/SafE family protein [Tumebacillus sp. DT12]|uniref:Probable membrane transporter protein n=1 Tax=Tumebacillus lacus TaxID=2995335 RepID=A0ABT3X645_9BACL|nr:sulfite exporter TauE/SafE family protein [Tumebacillus lacus]MCX7571422.1 sulfite exporter TauE/SafE family protein [Tumebacillus lacus]
MIDSLLLFLIGMFAGVSGSIVGLGGGFIVVPSLAFLYPMIPAHIVGTSMAVLFFNSISSTLAYARQKRIDFSAGIAFAVASIPGSILGAMTSERLSGKTFFVGFGCFLIFISFFLVFKPKQPLRWPFEPTMHREFTDASGVAFKFSYHRPTGVAVSFFVGFLGALLGIGGGSLLVPTMVLLLTFPPHVATATSMFTIFLSAIIGTGTHWVYDNIDWWKVLFLAPGAFLGGQIGARIAHRLPGQLILRILAIMLVIVAVRLIMK